MRHNFKKVTGIFLAALTALAICLPPVKAAVRPDRPGVSVCGVDDMKEEKEFPLNPLLPGRN